LSQGKRFRFSKAEKIVAPVIILVVIWAAWSFTQTSTNTSQSTQASTVASSVQSNNLPDFTLPIVGPNGLTGQMATFSSFHGKVILLEFMNPNGAPCQHMASVLKQINSNSEYSSVVIISVIGPWNGVTAQDAAGFVGTYGVTWTVVYDSSGIVASNFGVQGPPTFIIINKDGLISSTFQGQQTYDTLAGALSAAM
jgi:thiol-disulfide isomerase/thioredoxin